MKQTCLEALTFSKCQKDGEVTVTILCELVVLIPLVAVSIIVVGASSFIPFLYFKSIDVMVTTTEHVPWWNDREEIIYVPGAVYLAVFLVVSSSRQSSAHWAKPEHLWKALSHLHGSVPQIKWREISAQYNPKLVLNFPSDNIIDQHSHEFHELMKKEQREK